MLSTSVVVQMSLASKVVPRLGVAPAVDLLMIEIRLLEICVFVTKKSGCHPHV